jgi:glycosyl transferase family 11
MGSRLHTARPNPISVPGAAYVVALSGGLGNQLFQYALGRALAVAHGGRLQLDLRAFLLDPRRRYMLDRLAIVHEEAEPGELPPAWTRFNRRLPWLLKLRGVRRPYVERGPTFDPHVLDLQAPAALWGNWQSEKYFGSITHALRQEIQPTAALTSERARLAEQIVRDKKISVHVRRGDYASNPAANAFHGTCEPSWYAEAKAMMDLRVPDARYVVFSDDTNWARENLAGFSDAVFVEPAVDGRDEQDMHLMSLCEHHIIANSSFSWWGAWLNPRMSKVVIAPRRWFRHEGHDTGDLIPESWIRL